MKKHFINLYIYGLIFVDLLIYIYADFVCTGMSCLRLEENFLEPAFYGSIGVLMSFIFVRFFTEFVSKTWLRKIASWYIPLSIILLIIYDDRGGFLPSPDRYEVAFVLGLGLFIITLIYAPVMHYRLKKKGI